MEKRFFSYPGRELLVKSVLSAMPTYFLTVHRMPTWGFSKIDRFHRTFLWRGEDPYKIKGSHCLVSWRTCTWPGKWGGLGIKDLKKFSRVLRLKWLWHHWDEKKSSWKNLLRVTNPMDKQLFFTSTWILVGNGKSTPFWESRWLSGQSPKELSPSPYELARFKKRLVASEMHNDNWSET
jgi:hypothetical protein